MHALRIGSVGVLLMGTLSSCATMQAREWDGCAIGGGILGAAVGGITGGVVANNVSDDPDNAVRGGAIAGGVIGGGALGAVLGHLICDPEKATPAPPPPPPPPPPAPKKVETFQAPFFDFNKATLRPLGHEKCDHAAELLKKETGNVIVTGYTDSVGSDAYNLKLGERRAQAVEKCLVERGIAASRIKVRSKGKADPIASNATEEGRQQNRRVEIERE